MSVNRVLQYLTPYRCQRAEQFAEKWRNVAEQLETTIGDDLIVAIHPSLSTFINGDPEELVIDLWFREALMIRPVTSLDDASEQTIAELHRISGLLSAAADRLGGAA